MTTSDGQVRAPWAGVGGRRAGPGGRDAARSGRRVAELAMEHAREAAAVGDLTWTADAPERCAGVAEEHAQKTRAVGTIPQWRVVKPASALVRLPSVLVDRRRNGYGCSTSECCRA